MSVLQFFLLNCDYYVIADYSGAPDNELLTQDNSSSDIKLDHPQPGVTTIMNNNLGGSTHPATEYISPSSLSAIKAERTDIAVDAGEYQNNRQSTDDETMETSSVWTDRQSKDVWNNSPQPSPSSDRENHMWNEHMKKHAEIRQEAAD